MLDSFIIDLYTGHEKDSIEEFRKRTDIVIHRFNLNPCTVPKAAMYMALYEQNGCFYCDKSWSMNSEDYKTTGKMYLEQRKKEYTELKIDFNIDFIGEI